MPLYKGDLHIHTVLSPCSDLSMGPKDIISVAKDRGIDIIGITDHNSAKNLQAFDEIAKLDKDISILFGIEVETFEEIHVLCFFETLETILDFDAIIYASLQNISNKPDFFGEQIIVNQKEEIIGYEETLLLQRSNLTLNQIAAKVIQFGGMIVPAHVDRKSNGLLTNLGFIPEDIKFDAIEISAKSEIKELALSNPTLKGQNLITSSDAHSLNEVGKVSIYFDVPKPTFGNIKLAFLNQLGRRWWIPSE
ncbi:PHP domain-containing protein [Proteinivorax tanatarense]|uniref:PHP domain-containing protein n=1 Tax=Proteinivorax tanatarense TaxID=1260629 RepID=A0AAU7VIE0_9FIRM